MTVDVNAALLDEIERLITQAAETGGEEWSKCYSGCPTPTALALVAAIRRLRREVDLSKHVLAQALQSGGPA